MDHLLDKRQVANRLGVSTQRVKILIRDAGLPYIELPTGELRFCPDDLGAWVRQFRQPADHSADVLDKSHQAEAVQ